MSIVSNVRVYLIAALVLLAVYAVGYGVIILAPRAKHWFSAHTSAKVANVADSVITSLQSIATTVVADLNQRIVNDAKAAGTFTPALAASVKADAVKAVLSQGSQLVALGKNVVGDIESLVPGWIEQAVEANKKPKLVMGTAIATPTSTQTAPAPAATA